MLTENVESLSVVSWNMCGSTIDSINSLMKIKREKNPHIICLQEARSTKVHFPGYDIYQSITKISDGQHSTLTMVKNTLGRVMVLDSLPLSINIKMIDLNLKISNLNISQQHRKYKDIFIKAIQERPDDPRYIIMGDLNYVVTNFQNTYSKTRIDMTSQTAIDVIESKFISYSCAHIIQTNFDHLAVTKIFDYQCQAMQQKCITKQLAETYLELEQDWFNNKKVKPQTKTQLAPTNIIRDKIDQIKDLWLNGNAKQAAKLIERVIGQKPAKIVNRLVDLEESESKQRAKQHLEIQNAGIYYEPLKNKPLSSPLTQFTMGTAYYNYTRRHKYLTDSLRNFPIDKALGPDNISDRFLIKKMNALPLLSLIEEWINGKTNPPPFINDANLMLLSKTNDITPPIQKTRPIAMSSAIRKLFESTWMRIFPNIQGAQYINRKQALDPNHRWARTSHNSYSLYNRENTNKYGSSIQLRLSPHHQ